jgi:DNA-binding GntR family transcriptional regulator
MAVRREEARPIVYKSKAHAAYQELRALILSGELEGGTPLNQEQLAAELGVSTTPLREALRSLESEGLVKSRTHRDVIVAPLDPHELLEIYDVRGHLDALAARLAAHNLDDEARAEIEKAARELAEPHDDPVAANRKFHRAIYLASKNSVLIEVLEALWNRSDRYRRFSRPMATREDVVAEHQKLADVVLGGDANAAEELMRAHIQEAENELIAAVTRAAESEGDASAAAAAGTAATAQ